jgi:hypothetical protein
MKILETDRLILRHQTPADLESLWALDCDPDVRKYIPNTSLMRLAPTTRREKNLSGT